MLRGSPHRVGHWDLRTLKQKEQVIFRIHSKTFRGTRAVHCADPTLSYRAMGHQPPLHWLWNTMFTLPVSWGCGAGMCVLRKLSGVIDSGCAVPVQPLTLTLGSIFMPRGIEKAGRKGGKLLAHCFSHAFAWSLISSNSEEVGEHSVWRCYSSRYCHSPGNQGRAKGQRGSPEVSITMPPASLMMTVAAARSQQCRPNW